MLVLDGVYTWEHGRARFHRAGAPNRKCLERLLDRLIRRLLRRLSHDGWLVLDSEQPWLDLERDDTIDSLAAASIRYRIALGPEAGRRTLVLRDSSLARSDTAAKALTTDQNGFSLNAAVACQAHERDRLERLYRYITPVRGRGPRSVSIAFPPIVPVRSSTGSSTHFGTAPRTSFRDDEAKPQKREPSDDSHPPIAPLTWTQRLKRVFEFDITDPAVIRKNLDHINQRAPPVWRSNPKQYTISSARG